LLLTAETAWFAPLEIQRGHDAQAVAARFVPRSRRWVV